MNEPQPAPSGSVQPGATRTDHGAPPRATYRYEACPAPAYPLPPRPDHHGGHPGNDVAGTAYVPVEYQPVDYVPVQPKQPLLSLVASLFVPGLGTFLNGEVSKALVLFGAYAACWLGYLLLVWILVGLVFLPAALAVWVYGLYDAYQGAEEWNARHGVTG